MADAKGFSLNLPFAGQYVEQLSNQTNEIANNIVKTVQVNNQVAVNSWMQHEIISGYTPEQPTQYWNSIAI